MWITKYGYIIIYASKQPLPLEKREELQYNVILICQNEPINHTHATVPRLTVFVLVFQPRQAALY